MRAIAGLVERLHAHEAALGDVGITENAEMRHKELIAYVAKSLFNHDNRIIVIDKSGNLLGLFVFEVEERSPLFRHKRVCNVWMGYTKKNPIFIKKIKAEIVEWAKEKKCEAITVSVLNENVRTQRLLLHLGLKDQFKIYSLEVAK